jgi:DNA-binding IclR family transcriptional regulator
MNPQIKVIVKAFDIIEILSQSGRFTLKDITLQVKLPKPTVYRILNTLQSLGYVEYEQATQNYTLSQKFLALAKQYVNKNSLINIAIPYIKKLSEIFGETINLARLIDQGATFIHIEESTHAFRFVDQVGDRAPLHSTAIGKAIAAFLPEKRLKELFIHYPFQGFTKKTITNLDALKSEFKKVRELGYAIDDEEGHEGVICIGVPIFSKDNTPFAGMSISVPKIRSSKKNIQEICQQLTRVGIQISLELGVTDIRKCFGREQ